MRTIIAFFMLMSCVSAYGQSRQPFNSYISGLPTATQPLSGSDKLYVLQGGTSKVVTGIASLTAADQTLSGGANVTSFGIGTVSSGTSTVDCGKGPLQFLTNGGAFTLAAPTSDGSCIVMTVNNGSAGTVTLSGFTEGSNTGDTPDTTSGHTFAYSIFRINGVSHYLVTAYQ